MDYDTVVIYHAGCPDGACSAWAFTQAAKYGQNFGKIRFHWTSERDFSKDKFMPVLDDKNVYIVDYSYPRDVLEKIHRVAKSLLVLDHHKTAKDMFIIETIKEFYETKAVFDNENLHVGTNQENSISMQETIVYDIPSYCIFDLKRCGAEIVWDYLYGIDTRPWFIEHIRDRDLWLWKHPMSKAFSAVLHERGTRFEVFNQLLTENPEEIYTRGNILIEFDNKLINKLCALAERVQFGKYIVYALDSYLYRSECGNELAQRYDVDFAFIYRYQVVTDEWWISLRGVDEKGIDLTQVAAEYGGGGHPLASGFTYKGNLRDILKPVAQADSFSDE